MANSLDEQQQHGQINPGQTDPGGHEVVIKKNEGISDQGNEWGDHEGDYAGGERILGEKAEKYMKESADIEDLPDENDEAKEEAALNKEKNSKVTDEQREEDDVTERKEDYVPGFDLGRNKVQ